MTHSSFSRWWRFALIISCAILGAMFVARLYDESSLLETFPFDYANDITSYIAQLHFLKVCGYHQMCPYWYNGFLNFGINPPGWFFFTYPLLVFIGDPTAATYLSMLLLSFLAIGACWLFGRQQQWPAIYRWALFFIVFASAPGISNFIRLGRLPSFMSWIIFLVLFGAFLQYLREERIRWMMLCSILYSIMIVTHYQEAFLAGFMFVGAFFCVKSVRSRITIISAGALSVLLSSWWLVGFLQNISSSSMLFVYEGKRILSFFTSGSIFSNLLAIGLPLLFLVLFWFYHKKFSFFTPFFIPYAIIALLYVTQILTFLPLFRNIGQVPYIMLFLLFSVYFLFSSVPSGYPVTLQRFIPIVLIVLSVGSFAISALRTPWFESPSSPFSEETLSLLPYVEGRFVMLRGPESHEIFPYSKPLYSYAVIYHNLSTPDGWYLHVAPFSYSTLVDTLPDVFQSGSCSTFTELLTRLNTTDVISDQSGCLLLESCGYLPTKKLERACLYRRAP